MHPSHGYWAHKHTDNVLETLQGTIEIILFNIWVCGGGGMCVYMIGTCVEVRG